MVAVSGGLRGVAVALGSRPDRAIFAVNGCQLLPLSLYVPGLQFAPAGGATVREIDVVSAANQNDWFKVLLSGWYAVCRPLSGQPRLPRQMGSFRESGRVVRVGQFSVVRFRSRRPVRVTQRTFSTTGLAGALMIQRPGASQPAAGYSALGAGG